MKISDVVRELEKAGTLDKKTIHILANMMADIAWCKRGITQQFECYAEIVAVVKALNQYLSMNSEALDLLSEKIKANKEKAQPVSSEPDEIEETVNPYKETIQ